MSTPITASGDVVGAVPEAVSRLFGTTRESAELDLDRRAALGFTARYEGPSPSTIQTRDRGIISYGRYQATLASGTLERVITEYLAQATNLTQPTYLAEPGGTVTGIRSAAGESSSTVSTATAGNAAVRNSAGTNPAGTHSVDRTASNQSVTDPRLIDALNTYRPRVAARDPQLQSDQAFLNLLAETGRDPAMADAQERVLTDRYWTPAVTAANALHYSSRLLRTAFFDTLVQGGFRTVLQRTERQFNGKEVEERKFLVQFLKNRAGYLTALAGRRERAGAASDAAMLRRSAETRVAELLRCAEQRAARLPVFSRAPLC